MIEFQTVSREFRSLIHRRQQLMTFLGSVFAATGIVLQNVLTGKLPSSIEDIRQYVFAFYAVIVMVPSLILALRMARLHGGLILNGMLYARLMQNQDFTSKGDPKKSARHNFLGVSFLQFVQADALASFSAVILALALDANLYLSILAGAGVFMLWLLLYFRFHHQAAAFAFRKIESEACGPVEKKDWQAHVSTSLEDANTGLVAEIGFVGLVMFSVFEKLSGLGGIKPEYAGRAYDDIIAFGPAIYALFMLVACVFGMAVYMRVRVAIGFFCLQLDPTDRPFRAFKLTDSLLGFMLLAFLFTISCHLVMVVLMPYFQTHRPILFALDGAAFALALVVSQLSLVLAGRHRQK